MGGSGGIFLSWIASFFCACVRVRASPCECVMSFDFERDGWRSRITIRHNSSKNIITTIQLTVTTVTVNIPGFGITDCNEKRAEDRTGQDKTKVRSTNILLYYTILSLFLFPFTSICGNNHEPSTTTIASRRTPIFNNMVR